MFARDYFGQRMFAPRYWPGGFGSPPATYSAYWMGAPPYPAGSRREQLYEWARAITRWFEHWASVSLTVSAYGSTSDTVPRYGVFVSASPEAANTVTLHAYLTSSGTKVNYRTMFRVFVGDGYSTAGTYTLSMARGGFLWLQTNQEHVIGWSNDDGAGYSFEIDIVNAGANAVSAHVFGANGAYSTAVCTWT